MMEQGSFGHALGGAIAIAAILIAFGLLAIRDPRPASHGPLPANYLGNHIAACEGRNPPTAVTRDYSILPNGYLYTVTCSDGVPVQVAR
jgi:hypothetical protein